MLPLRARMGSLWVQALWPATCMHAVVTQHRPLSGFNRSIAAEDHTAPPTSIPYEDAKFHRVKKLVRASMADMYKPVEPMSINYTLYVMRGCPC